MGKQGKYLAMPTVLITGDQGSRRLGVGLRRKGESLYSNTQRVKKLGITVLNASPVPKGPGERG